MIDNFRDFRDAWHNLGQAIWAERWSLGICLAAVWLELAIVGLVAGWF